MSYPCTGCGSCCRRVDKLSLKITDTKNPLFFPYKWDTTGKCEMITESNRCLVYEERPLVCNIDRLIRELGIDKLMFYEANILECNKMMNEDNVATQFRINLK